MQKRSYTSEFKLKLVLEVLKEDLLLSEVASGYGVNPNLLSRWKSEFLERAPGVFDLSKTDREQKKAEQDHELEKTEMLKAIGQLTMERDYLMSARGKQANRRLL